MKKGIVLLLAVFLFALCGSVYAVDMMGVMKGETQAYKCSADADTVSKRIGEVAKTDSAKAVAVAQEMGVKIPEFQKNPKGYDAEALCKFYEDMMKKLD